MTDPTTTDRHTCHNQKTAAGPAWKCPHCSLPPADQTALRDRIAKALGDEDARACGWGHEFLDRYGADAETDGFVDAVLAVLPATTDQTSALLPAWEALYEPGNVSTYLIGYANDQDPATGMAEAWLRSQAEVTGRLEWVSDGQMATGRYDRWFELIERHDGGVDTGPGIVVRRRMADETPAAECSCAVLRTGPGRHLPECPNRPAAGARQDGAQQS